MKKYFFPFLVLGPLLTLLWAFIFMAYLYFQPYSGADQEFIIKNGESFSQINHRLSKKKLISAPRFFYKLAQWKGVVQKFRSGVYQISHGMTMGDIIDLFLEGTQVSIDVTIAEGKNIFEIAKILEKNGLISSEDFLRFAKDKKFLISLGIEADRVEGYLYPDTYKFESHMNGKEIISMMVKNFFRRIQHIDLKNGPLTLHELIIMSSIVEKETGASSERPIIAGVFLNRMRRKMRLQSDPTTIYGIYETFDGNLRKKHLLQKTPYNTYQINGLPAGPIANPGLDAIRAVLAPEKHNFIYFVSKNDGTHVFTSNYRDHLRAVNNWQKKRGNREGKSWRQLNQSPGARTNRL